MLIRCLLTVSLAGFSISSMAKADSTSLHCKSDGELRYSISFPQEIDTLTDGAFFRPFQLEVLESDINGPILNAKIATPEGENNGESLIQYSVKDKVVSAYVVTPGGYCGISLDLIQGKRKNLKAGIQCEYEQGYELDCSWKKKR